MTILAMTVRKETTAKVQFCYLLFFVQISVHTVYGDVIDVTCYLLFWTIEETIFWLHLTWIVIPIFLLFGQENWKLLVGFLNFDVVFHGDLSYLFLDSVIASKWTYFVSTFYPEN